MKVVKKYDQFRRDCKCDLRCEGCGAETTNFGAYDDRNYWDNVIPAQRCEKCGESTNSLGVEKEVIPTKYAAHEVV